MWVSCDCNKKLDSTIVSDNEGRNYVVLNYMAVWKCLFYVRLFRLKRIHIDNDISIRQQAKSTAKDVMARNLLWQICYGKNLRIWSRSTCPHARTVNSPVSDQIVLLVYFLATRHFVLLTVLVIMENFDNPENGFSTYRVEYFLSRSVFATLNKGVRLSWGSPLCTFLDSMIERA